MSQQTETEIEQKKINGMTVREADNARITPHRRRKTERGNVDLNPRARNQCHD